MKVILNKDIENVGDKFSVIEVKEGYARNFLFPRKLAEQATAEALKELDKKMKKHEAKEALRIDEYKDLAKKLDGLSLEIKAPCGEGGKLFGAVTNLDISQAIKTACSLEVDKKKIFLHEPIKTSGSHEAQVKIYKQIEAKIKVSVIPS